MNKFFFLLFLVIVTFTTYAFASSQAGVLPGAEGASVVSGYTVSGVHYQWSNDATLSAVEFDLNAPAGTVKASINSSSEVFFECKNTGGYHWVCDVNPSVQVSEMDVLKVIAMDK